MNTLLPLLAEANTVLKCVVKCSQPQELISLVQPSQFALYRFGTPAIKGKYLLSFWQNHALPFNKIICDHQINHMGSIMCSKKRAMRMLGQPRLQPTGYQSQHSPPRGSLDADTSVFVTVMCLGNFWWLLHGMLALKQKRSCCEKCISAKSCISSCSPLMNPSSKRWIQSCTQGIGGINCSNLLYLTKNPKGVLFWWRAVCRALPGAPKSFSNLPSGESR